MSTQSGAGAFGRSFYDLRKGAREREVSDALDGTLAQSDWIPLTLLRKLDHAPRDELCCWIGAVHEPPLNLDCIAPAVERRHTHRGSG